VKAHFIKEELNRDEDNKELVMKNIIFFLLEICICKTPFDVYTYKLYMYRFWK